MDRSLANVATPTTVIARIGSKHDIEMLAHALAIKSVNQKR
jgi:hypothetical protein